MRNQLNEEKRSIIDNIKDIDMEIKAIDKKLLKLVNSKEESVYLLEKLIELDRLENDLTQQNIFWEKDDEVKGKIKSINLEIKDALIDSIARIQSIVNQGLKKYISKIYTRDH